MSHVWGQTIPSNHWRLKHPQREFRTGADTVAARELREEILEQMMENVTDSTKDTIRRKLRAELGEEIADSIDIDYYLRRQLKSQIDAGTIGKVVDIDDLINEGRLIRSMSDDISGVAEGTVSRQVRQAAVRDAGENLVKQVDSPLKKTMVRWGVGGAVVVAGFAVFINSDALQSWVDNKTGMNCDEKAIDAGYEEGTPEYTESVETCQKEAADAIAQMGRILAYGGIGIAGLIGLVIVMRLVPKRKAKEGADDEE